MGASGLSPRRIFRPIFVLAAVLLLVMLALVEFLVPMFWSRMESLRAHDVRCGGSRVWLSRCRVWGNATLWHLRAWPALHGE